MWPSITLSLLFMYLFLQKDQEHIENIKLLNIKEINAKNEHQLIKTKYSILSSQLQNKLICDVFNRINDLLQSDTKQAKELINNFNKYLNINYSVIKQDKPILFRDEISYVNEYLLLVKVVYEKEIKLNVNYDIKEYDFYFPPLILLAIVENAFNHGISVLKEGSITLTSSLKDDRYIVEIIDDGIGFEFDNNHNYNNYVKLNAIKEGIDIIPGSTINIESKKNEGTKVTLTFLKDTLSIND